MIKLNFSNVENLIFFDLNAQSVLPQHYFSVFEQWRLSKRLPYLREMGKHSILDFLNNITDEDVEKLETYFGERIVIERLNYSTVLNLKISLKDNPKVCDELCDVEGFNYLTTWRDEDYLYISFWR